MKMKRTEFLKALETVKAGLANKEIIQYSTGLLFNGDSITTFNDEIMVSCPIPDLGIIGVVNASEVYALLTKIKGEELDLTIKENEVVISSGKLKAGFPLKEGSLPLEDFNTTKLKWKKLPEDFIPKLKLILPTAAKNISRIELSCIHVTSTGFEAADTCKMMRASFASKLQTKPLLIPATAAEELSKHQVSHMAKDQDVGWVHFKLDAGGIFSIRMVMDNEFPNLGNFFIKEGTELNFPKVLTEVLERTGIFSKREVETDQFISIFLKKGEAIIKGQGDYGWCEETVKVRYRGPEIEITVPPKPLELILKHSRAGFLSDSKMYFYGADWEYVLALATTEK